MLHKVKIESIDTNPIGARVFIDDNKVRTRGYTFSHYIGEVPQMKLELPVIPYIEYQEAIVNVSNKEEIARAMDKNEFKEFCEIWESIHNKEDSDYGSDN